MGFDTIWSVDKYKEASEYEQHWKLRKSFMEKHKKKYSESRLLALSKVFANIEFMGCIYNSECMVLVKNLAKQVDEIVQYWDDKKTKISRTLVKASVAAKKSKKPTPTDNPVNRAKRKMEFVQCDESDDTIFKKKPKLEKPVRTSKDEADWQFYRKVRAQKGIKGKLILYHTNGDKRVMLSASAGKSKVALTYSTKSTKGIKLKVHQLKLGGEVVAQVESENSLTKNVKTTLTTQALKELKKYCFTIIPTRIVEPIKKDKTDLGIKKSDDPVESFSGVGAKIMKMMGWKGEGLGKNESGITKPIEAVLQVRRSGLGTEKNLAKVGGKRFNEQKMFADTMEKYLYDYSKSDEKRPLQFSSDFTKEERKTIHLMVTKLSLSSQSYGQGANRAIRVKRRMEGWSLVEDLIANGGSTADYTLIRPELI